jgi:hypothetical protein
MSSDQKACEQKFCTAYTKNMLSNLAGIFNKIPKGIKDPFEKKLSRRFRKAAKFFKSKKMQKKTMSECVKAYCNPGCKGTLFEKGSPTTLPSSFKYPRTSKPLNSKTKKLMQDAFKKTRKSIFGKRSDVLEDDFYKDLRPKDKKSLKKKGAISGCSIMVL